MTHTLKDFESYLNNMESAIAYAQSKDENKAHGNNFLECMNDIRITKEIIEKFKTDRLKLEK